MNKPSEHPQDFRTTIGGQALIEGILMRGPEKQAIVIRKPDGELETKIEELHLIKERHPILGVPLIRGAVNFLDSMVKGVKALMYSAEFYPEDKDTYGTFIFKRANSYRRCFQNFLQSQNQPSRYPMGKRK